MNAKLVAILLVTSGWYCWGELPADSSQVIIGQPSIFWRNGEWQTYKNGVWTPYHRTASEQAGAQARVFGDGIVVGNKDSASGSNGKKETEMTPARRHMLRNRRTANAMENAADPAGVNANAQSGTAPGSQPNIGIGQNTIGVGQRNGIGQTTIGIGQPNTGIGPRTDFARPTLPSNKPSSSVQQRTPGSLQ